jgi:hypothetical protein
MMTIGANLLQTSRLVETQPPVSPSYSECILACFPFHKFLKDPLVGLFKGDFFEPNKTSNHLFWFKFEPNQRSNQIFGLKYNVLPNQRFYQTSWFKFEPNESQMSGEYICSKSKFKSNSVQNHFRVKFLVQVFTH